MKKQYMLRTCPPDMISKNGFRWPRRGPVSAPDWDQKPECGNGLHGLLSGCGDGTMLSLEPDAIWMVVRIDGQIVDLGGKIKTDRGYVIYSGDRRTATDKIRALCGDGPIVGATVTGGDRATVTGGAWATLSIEWWDCCRYRIAVAYVGEDGIEAGKKYRCESGKFVEATQ